MPRKPKNQSDDIKLIVPEKEKKSKSKKVDTSIEKINSTVKKTSNKIKDTSTSVKTSTKANLSDTKSSSILDSTKTVQKSSSKKSTTAKSGVTKISDKSSKKNNEKSRVTKTVSNTTKKNSTKSLESNKTEEVTSSTDLTKKVEILEFYDLPYRYNQTIVKVLAQTPTTLFIYWDISDDDRNNYIKQYGEDFFNNTKPVLLINNTTMNYSFEIEIDDFANSWYLHVNDSNCEYTVELGRRPKYYSQEYVNIPNNYLYVTSSNIIDAPNDHILFDRNLKTVYFRDVKTNIITSKDITSISFLRNMGKVYNLYDLENDFNIDSCINNDHCKLDLNNPSSESSSTFK